MRLLMADSGSACGVRSGGWKYANRGVRVFLNNYRKVMPLVTAARQSNGAGRSRRASFIREAAFASLKALLRPVPAQVDPTDGSEEREASAQG
jgi:hypothetical protein